MVPFINMGSQNEQHTIFENLYFWTNITVCLHLLQNVRQHILENGFYFILSRHLRMTHAQAEEFYAEHRGKAGLLLTLSTFYEQKN